MFSQGAIGELPGSLGGTRTICTFPGTLETAQGSGSLQIVHSGVDTQHLSSSESSDQGDQLSEPAQIPGELLQRIFTVWLSLFQPQVLGSFDLEI